MSTYGRVRTYLENGLRRTIPENVWKYVGSFEDAIGALDDALRSGGEANIELLRNDAVSVVKRLEEHFPAGQHADDSRSTSASRSLSGGSGYRVAAVATCFAAEARELPGVKDFRWDILDGRLLRQEDVPAWIHDSAAADAADPAGGRPTWLSFHGADGWRELVRVLPGEEALGRPKSVVEMLTGRYHWSEESAVAFLLTDAVPPITIDVSMHFRGRSQRELTRITVEVPY